MNSTPSQPGGSSAAVMQSQIKASFGQRALNYFKGTTQTFTNIQVQPGVFNKNLKMFYRASDADNNEEEEGNSEPNTAEAHQEFPQSLN
mmetsp:Transcript_3743/g.6382  ORF Transcript_3743/g.6382 Transcript_3743/m.6382 type:complete len:89 (+) Transcript_3743:699-965(+)